MKYSDGQQAALGDRVRLWESVFGTIMCSIDDNQYSVAFSRENWGYKGRGVVVQTDDGKIFYYDEADEDFELMSRAEPVRDIP
jgi:hypothetical protein